MKSKFSLVGWDKICCHKLSGGLGLKDLKVMSEIEGEKIWWRWCNYLRETQEKICHGKYAGDKSKAQLIRYNEERQGSHIWMKSQACRKFVQEQIFWEICNGETANLWDDACNQLPKLGEDPRWMAIMTKGREEGNIKVYHYWEATALGDQQQWSIKDRG